MDSAVAMIAEWMPRQRWFGGKGRAPLLRLIGGFELPTGAEDTRVRTLLVMDDASEPPILYHAPLVDRAERAHSPAASDHLIAAAAVAATTDAAGRAPSDRTEPSAPSMA